MNSMIIDCRSGAGFFSNLLMILDNLKFCEMRNMKPILRMRNFIYTDGRDKLWNHYFQPINDSATEGIISWSDFFKVYPFILVNAIGAAVFWEMEQRKQDTKDHRIAVNDICKRYIFPSDNIKNIIDDFKEKNFNGKILGVHVRGCDYGFYDMNAYINKINEKISNYDKIYLATDNFETLNLLKGIYGDKLFHYETDIRMPNFKGPVLCFNTDDKLKHGEDVLIEMFLLSNCDHLISINSNVPLFALYYNKDLSYDMVHRSGGGG